MIGKKIVLFADVRMDGIRLDKLSLVSENLLSVTGEDAIDVERKYLRAWNGKLVAKVVMFSNELIKFRDDSGALPSRFITWQMRESFAGREDLNLTNKLLGERSGILNLALDALDRLRARGYFKQPASGVEMAESLEMLASDMACFVNDYCVVGSEHQGLLGEGYRMWREWCQVKGIRYGWAEQHFSEKLKAAVPTIRNSRPRKGNAPGRPTMLFGIAFRRPVPKMMTKGGVIPEAKVVEMKPPPIVKPPLRPERSSWRRF